MEDNIKLEVAKDIISSKIAKAVTVLKLTTKDKELVQLIKLKERIENYDLEAINHVLRVSKTNKVKYGR